MKAPERIWIDPATDLPKLSGHIDKDSVEYTRTDAFIEKVCEWIETNMDDYIYVVYDTVTGMPTNEAHIAKKKVVEDIKNYMKGE